MYKMEYNVIRVDGESVRQRNRPNREKDPGQIIAIHQEDWTSQKFR